MGTSPAQSGNPLNAGARRLAARPAGNFQYVVVAPALPLSTIARQPRSRGRWQPVMPGSDSAGNGDDPLDRG